jgi:hypothetical protein
MVRVGDTEPFSSDAIHAIRRMRAIVHGFSTLESGGGFGLPEDLDETYRQLVAMCLAALPRPPLPPEDLVE